MTHLRVNFNSVSLFLYLSAEMLAVFDRDVGRPPEELTLPSPVSKRREEMSAVLESKWPPVTLFRFSGGSFMAMSHAGEDPLHPKSFFCIDDIYCIFIGDIENIGDLQRHYGLSRHATEPMLMIEIYKVLRDRAPYPSDQVIKDLMSKFVFILYDAKCSALFAARDQDGAVKFQRGVAGDGSLVFSDDSDVVFDICGISSSAFPTGCIFTNKTGLTSFVHPMYKVRGYTRKDEDDNICGVYFQVDLYTRLPSIPRVGNATTWSEATTPEEIST